MLGAPLPGVQARGGLTAFTPPLGENAAFTVVRAVDEETDKAALSGHGPYGRGADPSDDQAAVTVARKPPEGFDRRTDVVAARDARPSYVLPRMPGRSRKMSGLRRMWLLVSLVIPVTAGAAYFILIASNQYVTEFRFSVRVPVSSFSSQSQPASAGLTSLSNVSPIPNTDVLDNFTVADYIGSGQAARDLNGRLNLSRMYSRPNLDVIARLGPAPPIEKLERYWRRMTYSNYDPATGLVIVKVRAFTPADSYAIATTLLGLSANLVNSIGQQSQSDSVRFAQLEVDRQQAHVAALRGRLSGLRASNAVIDPATSTVAGNAALATSLRTSISELQARIASLSGQLQNPQAPQLAQLQAALASDQRQLGAVTGEIHSGSGGLTRTVGAFEDVNTQMQAATQILTADLGNLQQAQANADAQRLYIATYVRPALAQSSTYPNRWQDLGVLALVAAMVWLIGLLMANSVAEHAL